MEIEQWICIGIIVLALLCLITKVIYRWIVIGNLLCALGLHDFGDSQSGVMFSNITCNRCGHTDIE